MLFRLPACCTRGFGNSIVFCTVIPDPCSLVFFPGPLPATTILNITLTPTKNIAPTIRTCLHHRLAYGIHTYLHRATYPQAAAMDFLQYPRALPVSILSRTISVRSPLACSPRMKSNITLLLRTVTVIHCSMPISRTISRQCLGTQKRRTIERMAAYLARSATEIEQATVATSSSARKVRGGSEGPS